jgi:hypothetical protein
MCHPLDPIVKCPALCLDFNGDAPMERSRVALLAMLSICFIGLLFLTGIAAAQQMPPAITGPSQTSRLPPAPPPGPGSSPGQVLVQPRSSPAPGPGSVPLHAKPPFDSDFIRNHPGTIGGRAYVEHVRGHPHPGFIVVQNIQVVRNYYFITLPNGYPYYDDGYIDVDPQLDCYAWYDGDDLYPPGWYWTCD